jgi:hypothetical protein
LKLFLDLLFGFLAFCFIVGTLASMSLSTQRWHTASRLFYLFSRDQITKAQLSVFINELGDIVTIKELREMEIQIENAKTQ